MADAGTLACPIRAMRGSARSCVRWTIDTCCDCYAFLRYVSAQRIGKPHPLGQGLLGISVSTLSISAPGLERLKLPRYTRNPPVLFTASGDPRVRRPVASSNSVLID
jgi:hypothetical protein